MLSAFIFCMSRVVARQTFVRYERREWRIVTQMPQVAVPEGGQSAREGVSWQRRNANASARLEIQA
jgi:hypothetical protein